METTLSQFSTKMNNDVDAFSGSVSVNASSDNANHLETSTNSISRNLFSEMPQENGSAMHSDLEYLVSSSEENKEISHKNIFDYPPLTPNRNGDVLLESADGDRTETFTITCHPGESLGLVLGMNEIIDASECEVRKVYVKKISTNGATNRVMNESNSIRLGDEILAINGTYIKNLSRTECLNLLIDLPNEITVLLQHNKLPWTTGPRCSFYLNLVDKNPESILSPAPKLFTNEGKKIPDGYKLLEVSLYKETSDLLGISIVPSYGDTRHYYQIKELEPDGICSKSKLLNKGDFLVSCNGNSLHKIPFNQCLNILKSEGPSLTFEVFRKDDNQTVLESHDPQPIYDDSCEVNNNNNNNNDDDDGRSTNSFTSELLISTEIKPSQSIKPVLETNNQENLLDLTDLSSSDSTTTSDIGDSPNISKSHLSSFECDVKKTLSKPVLDFLTGSPFTADNVYLDGLQKPIDACPADSSSPSVIDEPCIQLTAEAVRSSPHTDWSSQLNMSEQSPAKETFSLDGLEEFSNDVINNANELNNNFNTGDLCSSNEDLISIDTDVLSPINSNPTLPFSNHADPWEAAGEAKSENLLPDFQISQSTNQKNVLNEFIDTVESPDYGLDPLDVLQENILQATKDEKCLSSPPTNFGTDVSKGLNLESTANVSLDNDLVEEERTSPISYDDSLSGSIGIHTADEEGDIPLSSRNSDNDLIEDMPALSPDSGRADSPGVYKNNSFYQEKFNQKEILSKLAPTKIVDDYDKLTDEENTVYHTVSDISKENKASEKFGSFDSNDSYATSLGSFESCAETGEQDPFGTISKPFANKNEEAPQSYTKSLPRNAFSNFKEFQTSMPAKEKYSTLRTDGKLFSFNEISSSLKSDPSHGKSDYLNAFSANLFSRNYRHERKSNQVRSEDKPFQVEVLKGIIGLGMTLKVDDQGFVKVTHIQNNSPIGRNGIIKVGDYILSINSTDIVGESDSRVQQILRLLPRGLIKVVASALPISDWKPFTEDAEKPSVGSSGTSLVPVSLTTPIKMSDSFSLNLSGRGFNSKTALEKKPSLSFSSALNVFSKDQSTDSAKQSPPPTVPSIPTSVHKDQCNKTETCVKSIAFSNNQSPQLDKMQGKHDSSSEHLPPSSPESVLNQVRMFENYFQKNNSSQELKGPLVSSKQKLVETFESGNQKPLPEKDSKEAVPDILQNGTAKTITNSHDDVNKMTESDNSDCSEDVIVPMKNTKYKTFSALPRSSAPRILDSFSIWDSMDSIVTENQNKDSQLKKKTVSHVSSAPNDAVKEEVIMPTKKTSVQSLVNHFNYPQDSSKSNSSKTCNDSIVSKGIKVNSENAINHLPKPAVLEETIEPIRKARITNMSKPLPISFSDIFDIDEVLLIEKMEKKDSKPDLKMTLTGPYSAIVEVSEPVLKPEKKTEDKFMKKPVASLRKSYILNSSRTPEDDNAISEVKDTKPEVCIGIARRLSQCAVPDCIDIMKIPEVVPTETAFHPMEGNIVPQVKDKKFETHMETPSTKRAKAISLLGSMDDDKYSLAPSQKLESKESISERIEVNEDQIISHVKCSVAMSAKPRETDNFEGEIVPLVRKSKTLESRKPVECQEINSSNSDDLNYQLSGENLPKCSLNVVEKKAEVIVDDIIKAAKKEFSQTNVSNVNDPSMVICDITGHTPCNEEKDLPTCMETASKSDTLKDSLMQIDEPESGSEMKPHRLSTQKRNLPLIENGTPKPLPRQSRQLSPSHEIEEKSRVKPKIIHRSLPNPSLKPEIQPSAQETNESWVSAGLISPVPFRRSVSSSDAHSKITSYPEVSSVESHVRRQETNEMEEKEKAPISPVPVTRTASLLTKRVDQVEMPPSPVSLQPSSTLTGNEQTDHEAPLIVKSSLTLSSAAKTLPQEESKLLSASVSSLKKEPSHFCQDDLEVLSSLSNAYEEEKVQNCLPSSVEKLPEVKSEIAISSSPQRAVFSTKGVLSASKIIAERPASPVTKPTSPINTFSSSPLLPEVGEKSPLLASTVQPVLSSKNVTENLVSSPSASQSTYYLETMHNDSAQTSPTSLSPRRFGSTNRKLPDIFQDSHTFKSLSSPTRNKSFLEELAPSESVPIEKNVLEHEDKKVREISKLDVSPSQIVRAEPKMTSDSKFKSHSIEIIENVPKVEVAVSQSINIEPTKASALLSEVKAEKQSVQVMEDVSKPEVAVSQFIGIRPTTATDLPEKKVKTHHAAVVEEIAKPEVAVSQFIGIKPTTASDLSNVKELKDSKVEFSKPEKDASSVKEQEQKIPAPKSEVAVSKFIGLQPTTATKLSEPMKSSPAYNGPKEPEKQSPHNKAKLTSTTQPDIVTSAETGRPALLRYKSSNATLQHVQLPLRKSRNEDSLPTIQNETTGVSVRRRMEKTRPRSEIFSKEMPGIFSKRKWCISTKCGQTNFAVPSEPETIDRVVQLGLIDEDDLSQLLTSANFALDKMSFSNNHEIHIAILEKDATEKIGIRLKKGEKQELVISLLEPDGAAIKQKFILIGDCLLLVNGKPAWNQTVMDMKVWLQTIDTRIILVLGRHPLDGEENDCEYMDIIFHKTVTGIGFCLEGGVGCPLGDRPISVKRIFKGGPAEKGGQLMVGDEILKVNDMDFQKQRHFVAWNHLKFLPAGEVKMHICRRKSQNAGMKAVQLEASSNDSEADTSA